MSQSTPDFSAAVGKLKSMMGTSEGQNQLQSMLGAFLGGNYGGTGPSGGTGTSGGSDAAETRNDSEQPPQSPASNGFDMNTMQKMQKAFSLLNSTDNKHSEILRAISPYLSDNRKEKLEQASKMLNMGKIMSMLKTDN